MALFKVHKGASQNLPTTLTEGYCWYTYNDSKFYIDFKDDNGVLTRKALNANEASKLIGYDIATILNSSDVEIPTSKAILDALDKKLDVDGVASSASRLDTPRTIDGVYFDGSTYITHYGVCDTASTTNAKVVSLPNFSLHTGSRIIVKFNNANTVANPSLNVNNTGPVIIVYNGEKLGANSLVENGVYEFVYNGSHWCLVGMLDTGFATVEYVDSKATQSDWSVNDETNPAYVKNRTHWKNDPIETVFLEETTVEVHGYAQVSTSLHFKLGETYTVMFNGEKYECVAWDGEGEAVYIGNGSIYGGEGLGGDEPFSCDSYNHDGCYLNVAEDGVYTISISKIVTEIHKLPIEFLPDEVLAKPDWNADEGEHGYVLNRTHYIEEVLEEVIPETTVTFGDATIPGYDTGTATGGSTQIRPEYGEMLTVEWNGQKYYSEVGEYTKQDGSFGQGVGNTGMFGGMIHDEYPFLIGFLTEEEAATAGHTYIVWVDDGSTTATFSVGKVGELVHKLDAKYMPENVAMVEQVQTKADVEHTHATLNLESLSIGGVSIEQFIENIVQKMMDAGRIIENNGGEADG